jgi:hypothetical protein
MGKDEEEDEDEAEDEEGPLGPVPGYISSERWRLLGVADPAVGGPDKGPGNGPDNAAIPLAAPEPDCPEPPELELRPPALAPIPPMLLLPLGVNAPLPGIR